MNEGVDSQTSQGAFRNMAVCVKCGIENDHLNSLLWGKRQKILGEFNLVLERYEGFKMEIFSFNRREYGETGRRCYEFHISGFPDTFFLLL